MKNDFLLTVEWPNFGQGVRTYLHAYILAYAGRFFLFRKPIQLFFFNLIFCSYINLLSCCILSIGLCKLPEPTNNRKPLRWHPTIRRQLIVHQPTLGFPIFVLFVEILTREKLYNVHCTMYIYTYTLYIFSIMKHLVCNNISYHFLFMLENKCISASCIYKQK